MAKDFRPAMEIKIMVRVIVCNTILFELKIEDFHLLLYPPCQTAVDRRARI
jgi:hypothetical protein